MLALRQGDFRIEIIIQSVLLRLNETLQFEQ
ncbi:Uncharacterised protein [Vibrio cholerae]|nr:Uncharacterised protein [Vibrio cholerae]